MSKQPDDSDVPDEQSRSFASSPCLMHEIDLETQRFKSEPVVVNPLAALPARAGSGEWGSERDRIELLLHRDGLQATRDWVERTLGIYRQALGDPTSHARDPAYRARFEQSVRDFEAWLAGGFPA